MARLEVITGPMFSGKSEELIRRLHVARHSKKVIMVLKPKRDTRAKNEVYSRKKKTKNSKSFKKFFSFPAYTVDSPKKAKRLLRSHKPDILAMDEGQFFDQKFDRFIKNLLKNKKYRRLTIIISGLDMTSEGDPFPGPMPQFMAMAHEIIKLKAVCFRCREWPPTAEMTYYKKKDKKDAVLVGDKDYEARCRTCHRKPPE